MFKWLLIGFLLLGPSVCWAASSVDDTSVKKWILAGLLNKTAYPGASNMDMLLGKSYSATDLRSGWVPLKACRDSGSSLDLNLAAAEHYLFIRYVAADTGDTELTKLPSWYDSLKTFATKFALENYLQTSTQPVAPVDPDVTRWGDQGVADGFKDYKANTGSSPAAKSSNIIVMLGGIFAVYTKYLPKTNKCTVGIK